MLSACASKKKVLYVYGWAGYFPPELLKAFEEETGIEAIYDAYESEEILETDLCMESSYDVVIITAWPSFARAAKSNLFRPLSLGALSNFHHIDPAFLARVSSIDSKEQRCGVPYLFGAVGLGINTSELPRFSVEKDISWGIVFDPLMLAQIGLHRTYLLDNAKDVFQSVLLYLGENPCSDNKKVWRKACDHLKKVRPFITRFQNSRQEENLLDGEAHVLQGFADNISLASWRGKQQNPPKCLRYTVPKEGVMLTIDMMAIPKRARNVVAAHKFINFVLRPKNLAAISNSLHSANTVPASYPWVNPEILQDTALFPQGHALNRLHPDFLPSIELTRYISDLWLELMQGHLEETPSSVLSGE
jgi:putrescine transport system substrate-binding protein